MGQGELKKRGRIWWMRYYVNGRRYEESAQTTRKEQADALLRERLQSIWEGRFFPSKKRRRELTVDGLRKLWVDERKDKRSIGQDDIRLGAAAEFFGGNRLLSTLTSDDVIDWRKHLEAKGLRVSTVNRHLAALRGALNYAAKRNYNHSNPMAGITLADERNERNRICTPAEYAKLKAAADDDLRLFVCIGYWLGMREGEIAGLKRSQIRDGVLHLASFETKEADVKSVPLPAEAKPMLDALPARLDGRVFRWTTNSYSRMFAALCSDVGIEGLRFHDLRHTAVTNMLEAGIDVLTIQSITGHKTLHMTKRYAHITNKRRREALAKVEADHAAGGKERS